MRTQFPFTLLQIDSNIVLSPLPDRANIVTSYLKLDSAKFMSQSTSRSSEYNSWLPYLRLSQIQFSVYFEIGKIQFLVTLPQIKQNIAHSVLLDRANTVCVTLLQIESNIVRIPVPDLTNKFPSYLTPNWAKFISQSTSRSSEYCSWLPYLRLSQK